MICFKNSLGVCLALIFLLLISDGNLKLNFSSTQETKFEFCFCNVRPECVRFDFKNEEFDHSIARSRHLTGRGKKGKAMT